MNQNSKLIKTKLGLLNLAEHLNNVTQACKLMGYSRDSQYERWNVYALVPTVVADISPNSFFLVYSLNLRLLLFYVVYSDKA
jgi:hypothetical protein